jgi:hypothetical protein
MSKTYPNVNAYWKVAAPFVNDLITSRQDAGIETLLEQTIAITSFVLQDFDEKRTKNQHLVGRIDSLVVLALDVLRGAHAAQRCLSLASAAFAARSMFEVFVTARFITTSKTPDLYADRFHRFQNVEKLNRHYKGKLPLGPADIRAFTAEATEWIDAVTGKPKKGAKWHAEGHSLADLADKVNEADAYRGLYSLNSLFAHGSSVIANLYARDGKLQMISDTPHVSRQSILVIGNCTKTLGTFAEFFGVALPEAELMGVARQMNEHADRLRRQ